MIKVNALGLTCPQPVIKAKKAINENAGKDVLVMVDNEVATKNLKKMGNQLGFEVDIKQVASGDYEVIIFASKQSPAVCELMDDARYTVVVNQDVMGGGDRELGEKLISSFIYSLTEQDDLPERIVFYNAGVKLTVEGSKVLEDLNKLKDSGVEILSCGLCLDYYGLKEKLAIGEITNMYRITEIMRTSFCVRP